MSGVDSGIISLSNQKKSCPQKVRLKRRKKKSTDGNSKSPQEGNAWQKIGPNTGFFWHIWSELVVPRCAHSSFGCASSSSQFHWARANAYATSKVQHDKMIFHCFWFWFFTIRFFFHSCCCCCSLFVCADVSKNVIFFSSALLIHRWLDEDTRDSICMYSFVDGFVCACKRKPDMRCWIHTSCLVKSCQCKRECRRKGKKTKTAYNIKRTSATLLFPICFADPPLHTYIVENPKGNKNIRRIFFFCWCGIYSRNPDNISGFIPPLWHMRSTWMIEVCLLPLVGTICRAL